MEQSVRLTHTFARERIAQLYIPLRELRFLARSAFLCNGEFQRNFLLHKKDRRPAFLQNDSLPDPISYSDSSMYDTALHEPIPYTVLYREY